jgi:hypothetical protein
METKKDETSCPCKKIMGTKKDENIISLYGNEKHHIPVQQ